MSKNSSHKNEFVECESCKSQPGSPALCPSCYSNRLTISNLKQEILILEEVLTKVKKILP